ncbi:hypothetical protein [Dehalogenimonas formicexedens]|nr:hypothetical protein [Dehalogenimonas formicexedens]
MNTARMLRITLFDLLSLGTIPAGLVSERDCPVMLALVNPLLLPFLHMLG